ncbi:UDP-glucose--hexose-1-phosphate uridylyltransferase [Marinilactibacillus kalidii]|uniref:UDP-glucose--hexose-1-phosphate uridylyltransferase n=1 Tax=Marinilactibacillus kalidii TaxID=2820274 RepID=UPI001ABDA1A3|nr:UDP-glucose--hexose-1-phosphate uridylyltransferase [Marinilactibacillus kalidii]
MKESVSTYNKNQSIDQLIVDFIHYYQMDGKIDALDTIYLTNQLLELLGKKELKPVSAQPINEPLMLLDQMIEFAINGGIIRDTVSDKDILGAKIMGIVTPRPSEINQKFWKLYDKEKLAATDYFYALSKENNYIKTREIAKNIEYKHQTPYGEIEITINLSRPEKDPKEIALAKTEKSAYPVNLLCMENEGYAGNSQHPGRANHRIIRLDVADEPWGYQYSPYLYYNEHAIFLSEEHRAMNVGDKAIRNLLDILTTFPHYFVGSNAGLPIVGGSILSHDHYQGGRHTFALERSEMEHTFELKDLPQVTAGIVKWPMSVIRIQSTDKEALAQAAKKIMDTWEDYNDETVGIYDFTGETPHNAITPIARMRDNQFELDLVLRNNRTSDEFPDGIFHPHPPVQHIKKENIGLIEVMGLAILPPRLEKELAEVERYLIGKSADVKAMHLPWAETLKKENSGVTEESAQSIVRHAVGEVFLQVLKDAGVFKRDQAGKDAFIRFTDYLKTV